MVCGAILELMRPLDDQFYNHMHIIWNDTTRKVHASDYCVLMKGR